MRHCAIHFAEQFHTHLADEKPDLLFCSDMLNLAEFLSLAPEVVRSLPAVVYFHENQLTYPVRCESERDYQFAMTNMTTALAANTIWFNSAFHRDSFLQALETFLKRMPDYQPLDAISRIRDKCLICPPGVETPDQPVKEKPGSLRILWAARWEHDKNPDDFFAALKILKSNRLDFRVSVIGERFRGEPEVFVWAKKHFAEHIDRWGYQQSRNDYEQALRWADVFVSTANHEFFGITAIEATLAGAHPVLPRRLAYPEIFTGNRDTCADEFFYNNNVESLAAKLIELAQRKQQHSLQTNDLTRLRQSLHHYQWQNHAKVLDSNLNKLAP